MMALVLCFVARGTPLKKPTVKMLQRHQENLPQQ
jgi:hypothetical protein